MQPELAVTGAGVIAAIGQGQAAFGDALLRGQCSFGVMQRPGRQHDSAFLGAEIAHIALPESVSERTLRSASLTTRAALAVIQEAWDEARLAEADPLRIGLVVGGSNFQQREAALAHDSYRERLPFLKPTYGLSFMDTDLCGFCTAHFGIRGFALSVGGASASGQLAIVQAAQALLTGQVDICIAVGALMDLSYWECQGLRALGAMGSDRYAAEPARASRPFDRDRDGFIYGESSAAIVLETAQSARARGVEARATLCGWGIAMDGNRNPDPSVAGETRAIRAALSAADWKAASVDYVNPHATGSALGDETELRALRECGLQAARLNATKSIVGHGLSAAGTVEVVAMLTQMRRGELHPSLNLETPLDPGFNWVGGGAVPHRIENALTLSMGFGGINTALCWRRAAGASM